MRGYHKINIVHHNELLPLVLYKKIVSPPNDEALIFPDMAYNVAQIT